MGRKRKKEKKKKKKGKKKKRKKRKKRKEGKEKRKEGKGSREESEYETVKEEERKGDRKDKGYLEHNWKCRGCRRCGGGRGWSSKGSILCITEVSNIAQIEHERI